ncbi:MAG: VOC family protein [Muribaculaceae bacterium]|nr:VOC family protein [Muribaculaceae bacterium]
MRLHHAGIAANDLELLRYWYMRYFAMSSSEKYESEEKGISCYFLSFTEENVPQLEIISYHGVHIPQGHGHVAISVGSRQGVEFMTELLRTDGNKIVKEPSEALTGTYMAAVLDPEGNRVEITE